MTLEIQARSTSYLSSVRLNANPSAASLTRSQSEPPLITTLSICYPPESLPSDHTLKISIAPTWLMFNGSKGRIEIPMGTHNASLDTAKSQSFFVTFQYPVGKVAINAALQTIQNVPSPCCFGREKTRELTTYADETTLTPGGRRQYSSIQLPADPRKTVIGTLSTNSSRTEGLSMCSLFENLPHDNMPMSRDDTTHLTIMQYTDSTNV